MAIDNKDKEVFKSSIEREQNELACSAEREKIKGSKNLNVPPLRFPEFTEEWEKCNLGDITLNFNLRNKDRFNYPMFSVTNNRGFIPQSEQFEDREMIGEDIKAYKIIHKNDFAYNPARINVGSIAKYDGDDPCMISSLYVCFKACNMVDADWLMQLLKTSKMNFYYNVNGEGGVRVYLFYPNFARISTSYPKITEQKKITKLLLLLDERIATQNKIIEDLKLLKSAIIERSYYNRSCRLCRIGDVIEQISERNKNKSIDTVLSVSNKLGFINQSEQFEDRIIASEDTSNYKIVYKNDFAYNPARINVGSIARLTTFDTGIVSPMYICFRVKKGVASEYMEHFFSTNYFFNEIQKRLEGSVRQCLSFEGICNISIYIPSSEEQHRIGRKISVLLDKIDVETYYRCKLVEQKHYLLRQMFI